MAAAVRSDDVDVQSQGHGARSIRGGDATVKRPELNSEISDQDWDNFVYNRKSLRGKHLELWQHLSGCRQWIKVERDTATHEIFRTMTANEDN